MNKNLPVSHPPQGPANLLRKVLLISFILFLFIKWTKIYLYPIHLKA